jgi:hypothetical protein
MKLAAQRAKTASPFNAAGEAPQGGVTAAVKRSWQFQSAHRHLWVAENPTRPEKQPFEQR